METEQIRLFTLLKDDLIYRKYFTRLPNPIRGFHTDPKPWRLIVQKQKGGNWARADYHTYAEAFGVLKPRLSEWWDATIHCKPQGYNPPVVKVQGKRIFAPWPEGHRWCVFCRRPTLFIYCRRHHMLRYSVSEEELRCRICGARALGMREFHSPELWPLPAGLLSSNKASTKSR